MQIRENYRMQCYASYALVLENNKELPALTLLETICQNFLRSTKLIAAGNFAQALSRSATDILNKHYSRPGKGNTYQLKPEFYGTLVTRIEEVVTPLLKPDQTFSISVGIAVLYERQVRRRQPNLVSVFKQARDSLRQQAGKE
jgi:hypothetical protein